MAKQRREETSNNTTNMSIKVENIKREEDILHLDHFELKSWTECEDTKIDIKNEIKDTKRVQGSESDYSDYSDGEHEDYVERTCDLEAPTKRRFTAVNPQTQKSQQMYKMIEKLCKDAPVSGRVTNMCEFKCLQCNDIFKSFLVLRNHYSKVHKTTRPSMRNADRYLSNPVCHICKLCSTPLLCDLSFIQCHLTKHKMLAKQYIEKFGFDTTKTLLKETMSDKALGNLCVYKCHECGHSTNSKPMFYLHRKQFSHQSKHFIFECLTKKVIHKCRLCDKSLLCDLQVVSDHLKYCHSITLEEYCRRTGCTRIRDKHDKVSQPFLKSLKQSQNPGNSCSFKCNICKRKDHRFFTFKKHLKSHKGSTMQSIESYIVKGFSYKCKKCDKLLLCDLGAIQGHIMKAHGGTENIIHGAALVKQRKYEKFRDSFIRRIPVSTRSWKNKTLPISQIPLKENTSNFGNMCTFTCPKCNNDFQSYLKLVNHCKASHDCNITYTYSLVSIARSHACLVCPTAILSDRAFITSHLYKHHKMSLTEYEKIFRKNGGKTLPSYNDWVKSGCPDVC